MKRQKFPVLMVSTIALSAASAARGATVLQSGDSLDGWKVTFPVGITLSAENSSTFELHKGATFDSAEGLDITFTQVSDGASPTITLLDETIANQTPGAFSGFQFLLMNTLSGNGTDAAFASAGQAFTNIAPFTHSDFASDDITLSGGMLGAGKTATFGGTDGGSLVIDASPASGGLRKVFDFKEIPVAATVPLPAALESGASLLAGLGVIGSWRSLRRRRAL